MDQGPRRWVPDSEATRCFLCARVFDITTRKHHCRNCGRVVCAACSPSKCLVPLNDVVSPPKESSFALSDFDPRELQRVCVECEHVLQPIQGDLQQTMTHSAMTTHHDRNSVERYLNSPVTFELKGEILKAANTLLNFTNDNAIEGADSIPKDLIAEAKGLAFITFVKLTDMVIVLNTFHAVEAFAGRGQVSLGTELSLSVGPVGRTASTDVRAGDGGVTAAFSYAHSKGVFIGVSVEAGTLITRKDANRDFYGATVTARELLLADFPRPKAAEPLYAALHEVEVQGAALLRGRRSQQPVPPGPVGAEGRHQAGAESGGPTGEAGKARGMHFAPFQPHAEDHLRSFTMTDDEKKQMEEDYKLALAMQKGEAGVANGGGPALSNSLPAPTKTSSMLARIGNIIESGSGSYASNESGPKGSSVWRVGSSRNKEADAWDIDRRARMEQARLMETEGAFLGTGLGVGGAMPAGATARGHANELGEMRSSGIGVSGDSGGFGAVSGAKAGGGSAQVEDELDDDSSDDDEYRRDIAEFTARKKGL